MACALASCSTSTGGQPTAQPATSSPPPSATSTTTTAAPPGAPDPGLGDDNAQIRNAIQALQDAYNTSNWAAFKAQLCPSLADQYTDDYLQQQRDDDGLLTILVGSVALTGDTATVITNPNLEHGTGFALTEAKTVVHMLIYRMQRQSDGWKICGVV
jgi:hypothetical protein